MIIKLKILNKTKILGITLFPFIFVRPDVDDVTINHEKIHIQQQLELLVIPFFILYGIDYLIGIIKYRDNNKAYQNIRFEREAYKQEGDLEYLKKRDRYNYFKNK